MPSFRKLGETPRKTLSDQQQQEIQALIDDYGSKTRRSKEMTQAYRPVFANIRNVAGFRPEWKELIYQIIVDRAAGSRFTDIDGREYLDITMGFGVYLFGHRPDFIESAVSRSLERGAPLGPMCADAGAVARRIHELTGVDRVAFFNTGSEAVMSAVRLARTVTRRTKVVMFAGSYHGHTDYLLATGYGSETVPMVPGTPESMVQETCVLPYGEDESLAFIETHGHELAAVLVEPVQSRRPEYQPAAFLRRLRDVTARTGTALIFDEMILGFRVHPGGAQASFGVQADIVTYGKTIGGGMPIGIVAGKSRFLDAIDGGMWRYGDDSVPPAENTFIAGTFNHHPLAMAAARAVLEQLEREGPALHEQLNRKTGELATRLNDVFARERVPITVVHFGSLFRFKLTGQWELFCYYMLRRGVYIWEGRNCFLSTAHSDADLDFLVRAVEDSVADMLAAGASRAPAAAFPLTTAQHRLYALSQLPGGELAYHVPIATITDGPLDETRLRDAVRALGRRHGALRTSFAMGADGIEQIVHPEIDLELERLTVGDEPIDDVIARFVRPFDLGRAPLVRIGLGELRDGRRLLVLDAQHAVFDGVSGSVFFGDLLQLYAGEPLPELTSSYRAHVERERAYLESADRARDEAYWLGQFAGDRQALDLPTDRPRPARRGFAGQRLYRRVDQALTRQLKTLARSRGTTMNIVLLAAHFTLLQKLTGGDDIVVGCAVDGRTDEDLRSVVGMFANTIAIRARPASSKTVAEFLEELKHLTLAAQEHSRFPFDVLVEKIGGTRDTARNPLFDTMFVYENLASSTIVSGGLALTGHDVRGRTSILDLTHDVQEVDGGLNMSVEFNSDVFDSQTVDGFIDRYIRILKAFVAAPADAPLHRIDCLAPAEREQLLRTFNDTRRDVAMTTVPQLIEEMAARKPAAVAVVFDEISLSYGELNARANRLAHHLMASFGAGRGLNEQLVGIALPRSIDMVVAVLATLKAGGAYLPLDPTYPEARLAAIIADAKPVVVLTPSVLAETLDALAHAPIDNPPETVRSLRPDSPAYVIYTSGSTGTPKGVVMEHHGLTNYIAWAARTYTQGRPLAFPLFTTLAFDLTVTSLFVPLTTGGRIVVYADDSAVPAVSRVFAHGVVDVVKLTPSHLTMIAHLDLRATAIRTLIVGGEDLKTDLCRRIVERFGGRVAIFNEYGPTEAAVGCMIHRFDPVRDRQTSVPIGVPITNVRIHVLDGLQTLVPIGAIGELYVAGDGLARGYLGRPDLTAERFLPDPFSSDSGARMYRTGDLARRRADGIVEYLGRADHQVKIRGSRVELGDVEAALVALDEIAEAAVIAHPDASGSMQLVAYLVAPSGVDAVDTAPLRRQLELRLPAYMVPSVFIVLDRLPLSSNGKLDRGALPSPDQGIAGTGAVYEAPRDDVERALAEVWQSVLGREHVGIHDNFFDLGGDSIKALQVVMRLQQRGYTLAPSDLFDRSAFPDVAARIRATTSRVSQAPVTGAVPLTPVQSWFAGGPAIDAHHFNQAVLLRAGQRLEEDAMRAVLEKLQAHHDALRMRFRRRDGQLFQENTGPGAPVSLDVVDLRGQPDQAERSMDEHVCRLQAALDLEHGPLMKAAIYRLPDADRLLLVAHHLVVDGVSWRVLLEDLSTGYDRAVAGRAIVFPAKTDSFQAWARHLQTLAEAGVFATECPYWEGMTAGLSPAIPGNREAADLQADTESVRAVLTGETSETLAAVRGAGATVQTVLLTALARALRQVFEWKQSRVTVEHHGRGVPQADLDVSRTVGWFTALYPLALALPDGDDSQAHLDYTRDALHRVPNRGVGYGVLRYLTPETPLAPGAEPRIVFNYLGEFDGTAHAGFRLDRLDARSWVSPRRPRTHELEVEAVLLDDGLEISLTFGGSRHDRHTMTALLSAIEAETRALLAHARSGAHAGPAADEFTSDALDGRLLQTIAAAAGCAVQDVADVYPLSPLQEGMLLHGLLDDDTSTFFNQFCITIEGALDVESFRRSWSGVLERHDALRALFVHQGVDRPLQIVLRERELPFHYEDMRAIPADEQGARLARFRQSDRALGFELNRDVLMRLAVLQLSERRFVAVLSVHHILIDGWCLPLLFAEMATTYRALSRGVPPALPDAPQYATYIRWLQNLDRDSSRLFWETYLRGFARPTGLPRAGERAGDDTPDRHTVVCELPAEDTAQLNRVAAERRVTLSSLLRAAWSLLLGRYNGSDDVVFGVVVSGRPPDLPGVERMIGMFINTVPLRIRLDPALGLAAFARRLQDDWRQLEGHHYVSLADVQSLSALGGDLLDHTLVVQNYPMADGLRQIERELEGLFTIPDIDIVEQANYPLMIEATPGESLRVEFSFDPQVHDDRLMEAVKVQLLDILLTIAAAPDTTVGDMRERLMTTDERAEREAFEQSVRTVSQEF